MKAKLFFSVIQENTNNSLLDFLESVISIFWAIMILQWKIGKAKEINGMKLKYAHQKWQQK